MFKEMADFYKKIEEMNKALENDTELLKILNEASIVATTPVDADVYSGFDLMITMSYGGDNPGKFTIDTNEYELIARQGDLKWSNRISAKVVIKIERVVFEMFVQAIQERYKRDNRYKK